MSATHHDQLLSATVVAFWLRKGFFIPALSTQSGIQLDHSQSAAIEIIGSPLGVTNISPSAAYP